MNFKKFAPVLLALGLSPAANAALIPLKLPTTLGNIAPVSMPGVSIIPMSLPTVNAEIATPMSLPSHPIPVVGRAELPGVPSPLPLPTPITVTVRPAIVLVEHFVLDWSLLDDQDGGEAAASLVPNNPGPQPLSPAGALNELRDATVGREPVRVPAAKLFDGRRETIREHALPHDKFF